MVVIGTKRKTHLHYNRLFVLSVLIIPPCRYVKGNSAEIKHTVLCSIIVNEWLKELAAIAQEHTVNFARVILIAH